MDQEEQNAAPAPQPSHNETHAEARARAHNGLPKLSFALGIVAIVIVLLVACYLLLKPNLTPKSTTDHQIDDVLRE